MNLSSVARQPLPRLSALGLALFAGWTTYNNVYQVLKTHLYNNVTAVAMRGIIRHPRRREIGNIRLKVRTTPQASEWDLLFPPFIDRLPSWPHVFLVTTAIVLASPTVFSASTLLRWNSRAGYRSGKYSGGTDIESWPCYMLSWLIFLVILFIISRET
jgi:hypothetical protein